MSYKKLHSTTTAQPTETQSAPVYSTSTKTFSMETVAINSGNTLGADLTLGTTDAFRLKFATSGTDRMYLSSGGVLSLGTTTTSSVRCDIAEGTASNVILRLTTAATSPILRFRRSAGSLTSPTTISSGNTLMFIGAGGYGTTGFSSADRASISVASSEAWTDSAQGTNMSFATTTTGGTTTSTKMTLTNGGRLGIGVTSPSSMVGIVSATALDPLYITAYATYPTILQKRANGTESVPTAAVSDNSLCGVAGAGYMATGFSAGDIVQITGHASATFTDTSNPTNIQFYTTPVNATAKVLSWMIDSNGTLVKGYSASSNGDTSALLDIVSSTKGVLIPRMTHTQMLAISSPATGLEVFNTTAVVKMFYNGTKWVRQSPTQFIQTASGSGGASSTASYSVASTGVGTRTIPAGTLQVGDHLRISGQGTYVQDSNGSNVNLTITFGGTTVGTTGLVDPNPSAQDTAFGFRFELDMTVRTIGATGTVFAQGSATYRSTSTTSFEIKNTATTTIDTTVANIIDVQSQWSDSSANNNTTLTSMQVEIL
jgi:hypothetical protein